MDWLVGFQICTFRLHFQIALSDCTFSFATCSAAKRYSRSKTAVTDCVVHCLFDQPLLYHDDVSGRQTFTERHHWQINQEPIAVIISLPCSLLSCGLDLSVKITTSHSYWGQLLFFNPLLSARDLRPLASVSY